MIKYAKHDAYLRKLDDRTKKARQLLWGDRLKVEATDGSYFKVAWGKLGEEPQLYWVRQSDTQDERLLEVVFVDVGQGDGCLLVSPDDKAVLIDAGERRNMYNFVKWRFGQFRKAFTFHAAVVTHSDQDHYGGFQPFFDHDKLSFTSVFHNGLAERTGPHLFGASDQGFVTEVVATKAQMAALYSSAATRGSKRYPKLMHTALTSGRVTNVEMLSASHGKQEAGRSWMPGFSPSESPDLRVEVLGPVVEPDAAGNPRLRWFAGKDEGKTKNGHSILLRLTYRNFSLLFGGDLNLPAEDFLLRHYSGVDAAQPLSAAVGLAAARLQCDVMKSCHHGSADVTDEFLAAVNPFAFTVSSGDQESHVHPRPDLLGRLGRHGRGRAPLVLCTEILRSGREREDETLLTKIRSLDAEIEDPATAEADRLAAREERAALQDQLARRNVEVYGAITLRTDGRDLIIAFRVEEQKGTKRWQTYLFRHHPVEGFIPVP